MKTPCVFGRPHAPLLADGTPEIRCPIGVQIRLVTSRPPRRGSGSSLRGRSDWSRLVTSVFRCCATFTAKICPRRLKSVWKLTAVYPWERVACGETSKYRSPPCGSSPSASSTRASPDSAGASLFFFQTLHVADRDIASDGGDGGAVDAGGRHAGRFLSRWISATCYEPV